MFNYSLSRQTPALLAEGCVPRSHEDHLEFEFALVSSFRSSGYRPPIIWSSFNGFGVELT